MIENAVTDCFQRKFRITSPENVADVVKVCRFIQIHLLNVSRIDAGLGLTHGWRN